jgi:Domain of unknown function (DUF4942)
MIEHDPTPLESAGADWQSYPTPTRLADLARSKFSKRTVERLLDACAGAGALADAWTRQNDRSSYRWSRSDPLPVDVIEIDVRHHPALREKKYNVVGFDFLMFEGGAIYSHVIMNPPFAQGARCVMKAWDMLWAGEVVAILNAETLRNPCSLERKRLVTLVAEHGSVEYISEAFMGADVERTTSVEVALIHLVKPAQCAQDWVGPVIERLSVDQSTETGVELPNELALPNNFVTNQCAAFRCAVKAMREAVRIGAVAGHFAARLGDTMATHQGGEGGAAQHALAGDVRKELCTRYLELKDRAWASVLRSTDTLAKLSAKVQKQAEAQFAQIRTLEFNESNVYGFLLGLVESQPDMQIDMACDVFDQITRYHSDNTVFYRGWKSNDKHRTCGWRIKTTRFILPNHGSASYSSSLPYDSMRALSDFDKVFALVDGKRAPELGLVDGKRAPELGLVGIFQSKFAELRSGHRVSSAYFDVRYYPGAGTIHFFARDKALVDRLNRLVGAKRQWLPPQDPDDSAFWKQYGKAEAFDREVRAKVTVLRATQSAGGHCSRYEDPIRDYVLNRDVESAVTGAALLANAVDSVLKQHGLLEALTHEQSVHRDLLALPV